MSIAERWPHELNEGVETLVTKLLAHREPDGVWTGRLSGSAVSTAVGALALSVHGRDFAAVARAMTWLTDHQNADGGWGDTPESPANLSAVLLARAALTAAGGDAGPVVAALRRSAAWLEQNIGTSEAETLIDAVLRAYGADRTFSVPILTVSLLSGAVPETPANWARVPALPFEAAVVPPAWYQYLRLPVVSYAIPALIAVGLAHFVHAPPRCPVGIWLRSRSVRPALRRLVRLAPEHGGFLEAAPLTGFVGYCLSRSGYAGHPVVQRGADFLRTTQRPDGSWPIDTDLGGWLTSLAVRALQESDAVAAADQGVWAAFLRRTQGTTVHRFNQAAQGGWSWTPRPGGVPDADDTAAALIALSLITHGEADDGVLRGLRWLLDLQNRDGGMPPFARGWGLVPFDRSCPDLTGHALAAFTCWEGRVSAPWRQRLTAAGARLIGYLRISRDADGVWTPLWFGDQRAPAQRNRVYGTAVVLDALAGQPEGGLTDLIGPARRWLTAAQNPDGGWGGEPGVSSAFETTAKAVRALAATGPIDATCRRGARYLLDAVRRNRLTAAPIGAYFASLWYDEELYPLIFGLSALSAVQKRARYI